MGANEISLSIAAGSVVVTSSITSTNPTIANRVETRLQSIELEGPARLQSILDPVGNQFAVLSVQPPVRTDPFGRMVSEPVGNSSPGSSSIIIIVILSVVILVLGALLMRLVWYRNRRPKRPDEPGPTATIVAPTGRSAANAINGTDGTELSVTVQPATSAGERPSPYPIVPPPPTPPPRALPSSAEELAAAAESTARIKLLLARNVLLALGLENDPTGAGGALSNGTPITLGGIGLDSLGLALSTPTRSAPPQPPSPTSWRMAPPPPPLNPQPVDGLAAVMAASHLETSLPTAEAWCAEMGVFSIEMLIEVGLDSDLIAALALRPAQAKLLKLRLQRGSFPPPAPKLLQRGSSPAPAASATTAQVEVSDATIKAPAPPPKNEGTMAMLVRKLSFEKKKPQQRAPAADAPAVDAPVANVPAVRPRSRRKPRSRPQIEDSEAKVEVPAPPPRVTLETLVRKLSFEKKKKLAQGEIAAAEVDDLMQRTLSQGRSKGQGKDVQSVTYHATGAAVALNVEKPVEKAAPVEAHVESPAALAAKSASPPSRPFTGYSPEAVLSSPLRRLRRLVTFGPGPLGMWLRDAEGQVTIHHVVPGSQAALQNVVVGSMIVSVAGRPMEGVPRASVMALMEETMKRAAEKPMVLELEFTADSEDESFTYVIAAESAPDVSELLGESVSAGDMLTDELLAALRAALEVEEDVLDEQLRSRLLADGFVDKRRMAPPFVPPATGASPAAAKPAAPAATTVPAPTTKEAEVPKVRKAAKVMKEAGVMKATKDAVVAEDSSTAKTERKAEWAKAEAPFATTEPAAAAAELPTTAPPAAAPALAATAVARTVDTTSLPSDPGRDDDVIMASPPSSRRGGMTTLVRKLSFEKKKAQQTPETAEDRGAEALAQAALAAARLRSLLLMRRQAALMHAWALWNAGVLPEDPSKLLRVLAGGASPARLAEMPKAWRMSEEHMEETKNHVVVETEPGPAITADDPHSDPMSTHKTPGRLSASARDMKLRVLQFSRSKPPDDLPTIINIPRKALIDDINGPCAVLLSPAQQSTAATNTEHDVAAGDWLQLIPSHVRSELPPAASPIAAPPMTETEMGTAASTTPYVSRLGRARAASAKARARARPELRQSPDASPVRAETALAGPSSPFQDELAAVLAEASYI